MANSFVLFDVSLAISPWENQSHTNSCFIMGNSYLPMGKIASVTALIECFHSRGQHLCKCLEQKKAFA